jgi:large subunit ribosomal protein L4
MATANTIDVLDATGKKSGSVELPAELFDVQTNVPLIHQVVVAQLAAARQGTHKTKTRGEVSGAGRKPFKQKGTGRARQGSIRAPQHTGGGIVHGPTPRDYSQRTPKKMIAAALLGILSDRARGERLHVVESFGLDSAPSTKTAIELLDAVATSKNVLVVLERDDDVSFKSVRNLRNVHVLFSDQLNAYDAVVSDDIVFTKAAFESFVAAKTGDKAPAEKPEKAAPAEKPAAEKAPAEKAAEKPAPAKAPAAAKAPAEKAPAKAPAAKAAKTTDEEAAK